MVRVVELILAVVVGNLLGYISSDRSSTPLMSKPSSGNNKGEKKMAPVAEKFLWSTQDMEVAVVEWSGIILFQSKCNTSAY